jgi:hypothetical protein
VSTKEYYLCVVSAIVVLSVWLRSLPVRPGRARGIRPRRLGRVGRGSQRGRARCVESRYAVRVDERCERLVAAGRKGVADRGRRVRTANHREKHNM